MSDWTICVCGNPPAPHWQAEHKGAPPADVIQRTLAVECPTCRKMPGRICGDWLADYKNEEPYYCASRIRTALTPPGGRL